MKQNMKKAIAMAVIGALAFTSALGNNVTSEAKAKTKKIVMNKKKVTLKVGKTFKLKVKKVKPAKASKAVTYKSSKKKVATVSKKGVIKAKKVGSAKITVTSKSNKKAKATVKVTVKKKTVTNKVTPTLAPTGSPSAAASATPTPTKAPDNQGNPTAGPATNAPDPTKEPDSTLKPTKTPRPSASPTGTPNIIDLPEYQFDIKEELWTNGFYDRTDNADGSITLTRGKGDADWQVGEFGFKIPRDKVGDLHEFTEIIVKYRDSDLTDDSTKCGYVFHMGDDTEVGWIESEDGGHPNTLSFNGTGQTSIYTGETKSGQSEANFSTIRIFDGKLGGKITIESVTLGTGKPNIETPPTETSKPETPPTETSTVETPPTDTSSTEHPTPTSSPDVQDVPWTSVDLSKADAGTYDATTKSLTVKGVESLALKLPTELPAEGKLEVKLVGTDTGGSLFRVWAGGYQNNRTSDVALHTGMFGTFVTDGSGGDFDITCNLTLGKEGEKAGEKTDLISLKGYASWNAEAITSTGKMDDLVITSVSYRLVDDFTNKK